MNTEEIMKLADAYADAQRDWGNGSERTRNARASLEAALRSELDFEYDETCPTCGVPDGGTSCGVPNCGLLVTNER